MQDKTVVVVLLLAASLMLSFGSPAFAFYHPATGTEDNMFENSGPRIDRILIKMYNSLDAEIAALQSGEIDITDMSLTQPLIDTLTGNPNTTVLDYGGDKTYYTLNFNNNGNQYLGNPSDPAGPNPVYPNPMSDVFFRRAVSMSINNTNLTAVLGAQGLCDPIYVPVPSYMAFWTHPEIRPGGALEALTYPYDGPLFPNANALLDSNGFPINLSTGFRYWDRNGDGIEQADELVDLNIYTRSLPLPKSAGDMEAAGLTAMHIRFTRWQISGSDAYLNVMVEQNYHSYTAGWINIGPDGDYLYDLYSYDNYFWDGENGPANWAAIGQNNSAQNNYLMQLKTTTNAVDAQTAAFNFEVSFASDACEKPLASTSAPKAFHNWYTGGNNGVAVSPDDGENAYRGAMWEDVVNQRGFGENSWWSTLNMYPTGYPLGDGSHMTVRYGWEQTGMPNKINPIYSSWYWESEIWGRVIDGGGARNPMTLGPVEVPQLLESWSQGTWVDPADGITKDTITVHMKPGVLWNDGQPCTIDDFIYTLAQLPKELDAKGVPETWWQPTLDHVAGCNKLDDYTAIILMKTNTFLATNWIVGNVVLPKHFWQPFIAANDVPTIFGDIGPGLIGTGPFLYTSLTPSATATLARNPTYYRKDLVSITQTFTATDGSSNFSPDRIKVNSDGFGNFTWTITDRNEDVNNGITVTKTATYQRVGPGSAGNLVTEALNVPETIQRGNTVTENFQLSLPAGVYEFIVTKTITNGTFTGRVVQSDEHVRVTIAGDINGDGTVDIFDIAPIALAFGSVRGGTGYNALADINRDDIIDIFDIVQVALVYGWTA